MYAVGAETIWAPKLPQAVTTPPILAVKSGHRDPAVRGFSILANGTSENLSLLQACVKRF